ncbi:hypothetical protein [Streptomyces sp. NPDC046939]|uniref:hypothetical protein n=1 Tax=Streptomyces sp. NPDC046939 TaxID=3155376 RepID=UPI0033C0CEAD
MAAVLGTAALLTAATATFAPGAAADGTVRNSNGAASVDWKTSGNYFTVHDLKPDGKATMGIIAVMDEYSGQYDYFVAYVYNKKGYDGPAVTKQFPQTQIYNGAWIRYQACLSTLDGDPYSCGSWKYDRA